MFVWDAFTAVLAQNVKARRPVLQGCVRTLGNGTEQIVEMLLRRRDDADGPRTERRHNEHCEFVENRQHLSAVTAFASRFAVMNSMAASVYRFVSRSRSTGASITRSFRISGSGGHRGNLSRGVMSSL